MIGRAIMPMRLRTIFLQARLKLVEALDDFDNEIMDSYVSPLAGDYFSLYMANPMFNTLW